MPRRGVLCVACCCAAIIQTASSASPDDEVAVISCCRGGDTATFGVSTDLISQVLQSPGMDWPETRNNGIVKCMIRLACSGMGYRGLGRLEERLRGAIHGGGKLNVGWESGLR